MTQVAPQTQGVTAPTVDEVTRDHFAGAEVGTNSVFEMDDELIFDSALATMQVSISPGSF